MIGVRAWAAVLLATIGAAAASPALAQQLYRWTDEKGRTHITDTPPPASARNVQARKPAANTAQPTEEQQPFELRQATRDFPVTLFSAPGCKAPCAAARNALNKRSVPFREVQVWDEETTAELKRVSGGLDVPTLVVGRSVHRGFQPQAYEALLDSARYPKAGSLPPRAQAAPALPEGYVDPEASPKPTAQPVEPDPAEAEVRGPYAPGATPPRPRQK